MRSKSAARPRPRTLQEVEVLECGGAGERAARPGPGRADERGSVTVWLVTAAWVMVLLVGLVVDLTGQVYAQQHARDVAAQAARHAGQQLNAAQAIRGQAARANTARAAAAARSYLARADVEGRVRIEAGTTLIVTTSDTYHPKFLTIIGLNRMRVHGTASARIVRAVGGSEQ